MHQHKFCHLGVVGASTGGRVPGPPSLRPLSSLPLRGCSCFPFRDPGPRPRPAAPLAPCRDVDRRVPIAAVQMMRHQAADVLFRARRARPNVPSTSCDSRGPARQDRYLGMWTSAAGRPRMPQRLSKMVGRRISGPIHCKLWVCERFVRVLKSAPYTASRGRRSDVGGGEYCRCAQTARRGPGGIQ
ncbi:hypothetical protein OH77DRAFT_1417489 [Trametes cingulata]|nr:hypothetical protein OH77DRAFT_1417489 [Trametes cingulata]